MPSISTMTYPIPAYVRVEVNWADVTQATGAKVERVDCETGARTPLRPYVSFNGDYLTLSCGYAIFWDTEAPLDRCFYYCTTAVDSSGTVVTTAAAYLYFDDFTRTETNTWGTSTSGHTYTLSGGTVPDDYDVNGTQGTITISTETARLVTVDDLEVGNGRLYGTYIHPVVPTGADHEAGVRVRAVDGANFLDMRFFITTANTVGAVIRQVIAGVESAVVFSPTITFAGGGNVLATTPLNYMMEYWDTVFRVKVWASTDPEPAAYNATTTVSFVSAGSVAYASFIPGASTNVMPYTLRFDNHRLEDPCAELVTIEQCSQDMTVPSSGNFRLGDPVRPCSDVTLLLDGNADPDCVPTQGIFFGNMSEEVYGSVSGALLPVNAVHPIVVNRRRRAAVSTLTVASRTFMDRDALRLLNDPGSALFLRTPAAYGIYDRYMSVGDVTETRPVSDHKVQPRMVTMPHAVVARPSGPSQGVCGTRVTDLCDIYATWDDLAASGLTWADLLRGAAGSDAPAPASTERTWSDVNADFANWTAVNAGNSDWDDVLDGA